MSTKEGPVNLRRRSGARLSLLMISVALFALAMAACESKPENQNTNQTAPSSARNANQSAPAAANQNVAPTANSNQAAPATTAKNRTVTIETAAGRIKLELLDSDAPKTADNFRKLAQQGFYNGLIFHRIISSFMIQGGDPNGNGTGGKTADGQPLPNEIVRNSPLYQNGYHRGDVAMANRGRPETGSSQFFIMHQDRPLTVLPPNYTIFAKITEGMDVVDKIISAPVTPGTDRPTNPIKMTKVTVQ